MSTAPSCQFANFCEAQPEFQPPPVYQPQDWSIQPTPKNRSRQVIQAVELFWEIVNLDVRQYALADRTTQGLDETYVLENRPEVTRFIEVHRLHGLLLQATKPLKEKFGGDSVKTLSIVSDDEGFESLFCVVVTSGDLRQTRQALRAFDREWWLYRARQAAGRLNFDFKMI